MADEDEQKGDATQAVEGRTVPESRRRRGAYAEDFLGHVSAFPGVLDASLASPVKVLAKRLGAHEVLMRPLGGHAADHAQPCAVAISRTSPRSQEWAGSAW